MKATELRSKTRVELQATLDQLAKTQFKLKMQLGNGQLSANHLVRAVRRDIARVKTILTELQRKEV